MSSTAANPSQFKELDESGITPFHWKVMFVSGMGFFTDAYDLFIIGVVIKILTPMWKLSPFQVSLVDSTAFIASAIGAIVLGRVADMLGRKRIYGFEVLVLAAGAIASALSPSYVWLIVFRFILGLGIGGDYPVSATIMSEYAGKRNRGLLVSLIFAMQGAGLVLGPLFAAVLLASGMDQNLVWRIMLAFGAVPALAVFYLRRHIQETPRFAQLMGDEEETAKAAQNTTGNARAARQDQGGRDDGRSHGETKQHYQPTVTEGYRQLLADGRLFRWLIGAAATWFLLDFAYYGNTVSSPLLLAALDPHKKLLTDVLLQLLIFAAFALPGYAVAAFTLDRLGRKWVQIFGFAMMAVTFAAMFVIPDVTKKVVPFVIVFGLTYFFTEFGPNTTTFVYPSEIFPVHVRTTAHGLAASAGKLGAWAGAFAVPLLLHRYGIGGAEIVVAAVCLIGLVFTLIFLPETKGKSLEEISGADNAATTPSAREPAGASR